MERDFKGVWIPKEIFLNEALSWAEKILLIEIDSLDQNGQGCFASNEYLAKFVQVSEGSMANMIVKLMNKGYIIKKGFDGRKRYVSLNPDLTKILSQTSQKYESRVNKNMNSDFTKTLTQGSQKNEHINTISNTINNTIINKQKKEKKHSPSIKNISVENLEYYQEFCQVINYLSEKTDVKYNIPKDVPTLKKYKNYILILEILKDGNDPDALMSVIDSKYNEWISDEKMCKYLVPSTLFRKSNFEKYLTQSQIKSVKTLKNELNNSEQQQEIRRKSVTNIVENALKSLNEQRQLRDSFMQSVLGNQEPK
jgi:uncharacterized phage protein (TIGR02220 family)